MERISGSSLIAAVGGTPRSLHVEDFVCNGISIDSRTLRPGELFWAIPGERYDGHDFVADAIARGASACVIARDRAAGNSIPAILVDHTVRALWDFANWHRRRLETLVIGVTGSFGKTTTREMIHTALQTGHSGIRSLGNLNNHIGLPLCIFHIESHHDYAVLEMGASAIGEIADLTRLAAPEIGVITGIGPAHLSGFGSLQGIIQAKGELLEGLPETGFAVLPGDEWWTPEMTVRAPCPVIYVGTGPENDIQARNINWNTDGLTFSIEHTNFQIPVLGRHFLIPALSAIAIGREIGMSLDLLAEGLRSFQSVSGRCQLQTIGAWTVIHDAYNANPASMSAACELLADWPMSNRKLMFVGDMLELGEESPRYHFELGGNIARARPDALFVWGEQSAEVVRGARSAGMEPHRIASAPDWNVMLAVLDCWLEPGDVILIKGSRGMRLERVIEWLRSKVATSEKILQPHRQCA